MIARETTREENKGQRSMNKPVYFLHIPKNAGTSLNQIMRRNYKRIFKVSWDAANPYHPSRISSLGKSMLEGWDAISGHFSYGLHEAFGEGEKACYITLLRDPIARTVSAFNYLRNDSRHINANPELKSYLSALSIVEFCHEPHCRIPNHIYMDNGQVRFLSGVGEGKPFGGLSRADLEMAKQNLERMEFGIAGSFDLSMLHLQRRLGWKSILYSRAKVGSATMAALSEVERRAITERNVYDLELYEFGKEMFRQRTADIRQQQVDAYTKRLARHEYLRRLLRVPRAILRQFNGRS